MPLNEDVSQLQLEWRKIVLDKLNHLEAQNNRIASELHDHRMKAAEVAALNKMGERVSALENFKWQLIGIAIGTNGFLALVVWAFDHLGKK